MSPPRGGLILVDKPVGPSSFAVVRDVRRRLGLKAGHAGTLDPAASGLLLVLVGPATRLARYLVGLDKRYSAAIRLGLRTTTGDAEGELLEETAMPGDVAKALDDLRGEVALPIPAASAVKIGGERAYRLQRRGVPVEMPVRRSTVYELDVRRFDPPQLEVDLHVESGTYVRAIADALGGHCIALRRTAVGPFRVEDADEQRVLEPLESLPFLPELELSPGDVERVRNGQDVACTADGRIRLVVLGQLVAVARAGGGVARPETVLPS